MTPLTKREQEILELRKSGLTHKAIAEALKISPNTVKNHVANMYRKDLQAKDDAEEE